MKKSIILAALFITILFHNLSWALGKCTSGNCVDGHGTAEWPSGNKYTGSYQNGKRNGQGIFIWATGDRYIGEYKDGKMHGMGTYFFSNGAKYEGEYVENVRNGFGIYTWPNGARYEGQYQNGKKNGKGKFIFPGGVVMNGSWQNDAFLDSVMMSGNTDGPKTFSLTVNPLPTDATIKILDIKEAYTQGMKLSIGRYKIEISHPDYLTKVELVDIRDQNMMVPVTLELAPIARLPEPKDTAPVQQPITKTEVKETTSISSIPDTTKTASPEPTEVIAKNEMGPERKLTLKPETGKVDDLIQNESNVAMEQDKLQRANELRIEAALQENENAQKISMIEQLHQEVGILKESFQPAVVAIEDLPTSTSENYERIALVIGNSRYPLVGELANPENDARDMAEKLRALGFDVIMKLNADQQEMESAIVEFGNRIKNGGLGLFYYAGHALQMDGINFLVPVESRINKPNDIKYKAVNLNMLLDEMTAAKNGKNIIILDSCRDNPLPKGETRRRTVGLARTEAPAGTLIAYATSPGSVAIDGKGRNGIYTKYLLSNMNTPNIPIETVFKRVLQGVSAETERQQIPWMSSSLDIDFYFVKKQNARTH